MYPRETAAEPYRCRLRVSISKNCHRSTTLTSSRVTSSPVQTRLEVFMRENVFNYSLEALKTLHALIELCNLKKGSIQPRHVSFHFMTLRQSLNMDRISSILSSKNYKRLFRMNRRTFNILLGKLRPFLQRDERMGKLCKRGIIPPSTRLAITLRILAGGCALEAVLAFAVGLTSVYEIFHSTLRAIHKVFKLPGLPSTEQQCHDLALRLKTSRKLLNPLTGCIGAIDGIALRIVKPKKRPAAYWSRKGFYAATVQAMVDSDYRFMWFSAMCIGSAHDSLAFQVSKLAEALETGIIPAGYFICGDEAYMLSDKLIVPYPLSQCGQEESNFNYFLSSMRVQIEQAFGQLVHRWGILRNVIMYDIPVVVDIVHACMVLHNFCIDHKDGALLQTVPTAVAHNVLIDFQEWYEEAKGIVLDLPQEQRGTRIEDGSGTVRDRMRDHVTKSGKVRPPVGGLPVSR